VTGDKGVHQRRKKKSSERHGLEFYRAQGKKTITFGVDDNHDEEKK